MGLSHSTPAPKAIHTTTPTVTTTAATTVAPHTAIVTPHTATSSMSATLPAVSFAAFNGATMPMTNPCTANIGDTLLTFAMVKAQYPGVSLGPKLVTPEQMQCWAWLSTQSKEVHPSEIFSKQFGHEPYLVLLV